MLFTNPTMNEIMIKPLTDYDSIQQVADMMTLRELLQSYQDDQDVYRIRLYVRDELIYANDLENLFPIGAAMNTAWYQKTVSGGSTAAAFLSGEDIDPYEKNDVSLLSIARRVTNQQNYRESVGVFRVDFEQEKIVSILRKADATSDSLTFLLSENGGLVASSGAPEETRGITGSAAFLTDLDMEAESFQEMTVAGNKALVRASQLPNTGWRMITVVPYASFMNQIDSLRNASFVLAGIISSVACVFAVFFSRSITVRLTRLAKRMGEMRGGNTQIDIPNDRHDEIGELYSSYNYLVERLNELLQEQYEMGQELKNAELKALQSQINPHFLYNTLDMINWYGYKKEPEQINAVVTALAKFYKQSLNKGSGVVTVADELKHISYYIQIQRLRFSDHIQFHVTVAEDVLDNAIPKITLQPLVENAILHGILEKEDRSGTIAVHGERRGALVVLSVTDDGVGMEEFEQEGINGGERESAAGGYGLMNIDQRIKLLFGESYGLRFSSVPGHGTKVEIHLPVQPLRELRP